jgi:hypothetical protein
MRLVICLLLLAGCKRSPDEAERLALGVVEAARSDGGIGPELVDADLIERIRRVQLVRRATLDTTEREALLRVLSGESGPDRRYPPSERPRMQRERATRGVRAHARGACTAKRDDTLTAERMRYLTEPPDGVPVEVAAAQRELIPALRGGVVVRLTCSGEGSTSLGVLVVKGNDGKLRVVDLYPLVRNTVEINPDDPAMK